MRTKSKEFASKFAQDRAERLLESREVYHEAERLAQENGLSLRRLSDKHYILRSPFSQWQVNVYPAAQQLAWYSEKRLALNPERPWTVLDCVKAAVEAT